MSALVSLDAVKPKFPPGSTVSYKDATIHPPRKARTGLVREVRLSQDGNPFVRIDMPKSVLDTIPENVTLIRHPNTRPTPNHERLD